MSRINSDEEAKQNIRCTNQSAHTATTPPVAAVSCIGCAAYLCTSCNTTLHKHNKHNAVPVKQLKSYIVYNEKGQGESHVRRNIRAINGVDTWDYRMNGCSTLYETYHRTIKLYPQVQFLGQRTVNNGVVGPYKFITYAEADVRVENFGSGLLELGAKKGDRIGLYSINRPEWILAEYSCYNHSLIPVPLYDTLGHDAAEWVITQSELRIVVTSIDKLDNVVDIAKSYPGLKYVIVMPRQPFDPAVIPGHQHVDKTYGTCKIISFAAVEQLGSKNRHTHQPPATDDVFTFSYTSGTTGKSKGAMITHRNMISNISGIEQHSDDSMKFIQGDVHISYLPLAHMYERTTVSNMIAQGGGVGFVRGDPLKLLEDMEALQPSGFPIVPRLANRIYDAIINQVNTTGGIKAKLFHHAYQVKLKNWHKRKQLTHPVYDRIIFSKVAQKIGGKVRIMVTGSAPLSDEVKNFLRVVFSCPVYEGYGQTEANAGVTVDIDGKGCVGFPLPCNEIKLVDVPEMKYLSTDMTAGKYTPRGEVCVRGHNRFKGYWKDPEKTSEAIDDAGWLHSGDIGRWNEDGTLSIIDRKKNIFKLAQGEYIAPEKIENVYARAKYVAQSFVYGDSLQSDLVAIVVPDVEVLTAYAKQHKLSTDMKQLCNQPKIRSMIYQDMIQAGKQGRLQSFEQVKSIRLYDELFSVENDILTPTMKLKRPYAKDKFQQQIDEMYAEIKKNAKPASKL